jgi:hypothetical protein
LRRSSGEVQARSRTMKQPAVEGKQPAIEGKQPAVQGKQPAVEGKQPAIEGKKTVRSSGLFEVDEAACSSLQYTTG